MMEAAIWGKPVFYGPSIGDFRDAAELLESAGAGFPVDSVTDLERRIRMFRERPAEYGEACLRAGEVAGRQLGAARRQVEMILHCLKTDGA